MLLNMRSTSVSFGSNYIKLHALIKQSVIAIQSEALSKSHVVELMASLTWSQAPQTRSKANKEAEKPISQLPDSKNLFDSTPLKFLYLDGMDEEQVWAQLDLRTNTICRVLDFVLEGDSEAERKDENAVEGEGEYDVRLLKALEDLEREGFDLDDLMGDDSESSSSQSSSSPSGSDLPVEDDEGEENYSSLRDPSEDEDEEDEDEDESPVLHSPKPFSRKKKDPSASELDDDFFNLAEFNAESERAEARSSSIGRLAEDDESDEDMDIDLFASVDPVENFDEEDLEGNPDGTYSVSHDVIYNHGYFHSQFFSITIFSSLPRLHRQVLKPSRKCAHLVQVKSVSTTKFASRKPSPTTRAKITVYLMKLLAKPKVMTMTWNGVTRMKKWRTAKKRRIARRIARKGKRKRKRKMTMKMRRILNLVVGKQLNV